MKTERQRKGVDGGAPPAKPQGADAAPDLERHAEGVVDPTGAVSSGIQRRELRPRSEDEQE